MAFSSNEYSWRDVTVTFLGRNIGGLRSIEYKVKHQKEAIFGAGYKPRGIQFGKKEVEGTITLFQSELIALNQAAKNAGYSDATDIEFDVIISYIPDGGVVTTDKVISVSITELPHSIKEGDLYQEIALPFIAMDLEYAIA